MEKSYKIKLTLFISIFILATIILIVKGIQWYWCIVPGLILVSAIIIVFIIFIKQIFIEKPGDPFVETIMDMPTKKPEPFYMQFIHKWNKDRKRKTICYKNLTSGNYFKFTPIPNLSDKDFKGVLVNIPLKYNEIVSEKVFNKKYKGIKLMEVNVMDAEGKYKIGTVITRIPNLLRMPDSAGIKNNYIKK